MFTFEMSCGSSKTCSEVNESIRSHSDFFVADLTVYYGFNEPKSRLKLVNDTREHSKMSTAIANAVEEKEKDYLRLQDAAGLVRKVVESIVEDESTDDEFYQSRETLQLEKVVERATEANAKQYNGFYQGNMAL